MVDDQRVSRQVWAFRVLPSGADHRVYLPFRTGAAIMIMSLVLFENEFLHIVAISFTALILNELIMVALEITTWYARGFLTHDFPYNIAVFRHIYMVISEIATLFFYVISIAFLPEYFGK